MSIPAPKGSESEFLQQIASWKPIAAVYDANAHSVQKKRSKAGPSSRQAAAAGSSALSSASSSIGGASSLSATTSSPSRYFLYLEAAANAPTDSFGAASAASSSSSTPGLRLIVSNILSVWSSSLDLSAFRRHREGLGIAAVGWREIFQMLRSCFQENRVSVTTAQQGEDDTGNSHQQQMTVNCRYNIGSEVELEGKFTLQRVQEESNGFEEPHGSVSAHTQLNQPQQLLSHLLFGVFAANTSSDTATIAPLQAQIATMRSELTSLRAELGAARAEIASLQGERSTWLSGSSSSSSHHASGTQHSFDGSASSSTDAPGSGSGSVAGQKRKQPPVKAKNMSILNPNSKRRKVGGFKIE